MRKTPLKRLSDKRAKKLGRKVYSTIGGPRKEIARRGKPKARNVERQAREFARTCHSVERKRFVAALPCVACGGGPCDNAHIAGDGAGRKAGYEKLIPLCRRCHRLQHDIGAGSFAIRFSLNLRALAAATERLWQSHINQHGA